MFRLFPTICLPLLALILAEAVTFAPLCAAGSPDHVRAFGRARKNGDVDSMKRAISELVKTGVLKKGMTRSDVIRILGEPDTGSGIFVPGGRSIGYGKGRPGVDYRSFVWLHFREPCWKTENPKGPLILIGWDVPVRDICQSANKED